MATKVPFPRPGWAIIERYKEPSMLGQFWVPDIAKNRKLGPGTAYQAKVIAVSDPGERIDRDRGKFVRSVFCAPDLQEGDQVIVEAMSYHPVGVGWEFVRCEDIIAVLNGVDIEPVVLRGHQAPTGATAGSEVRIPRSEWPSLGRA